MKKLGRDLPFYRYADDILAPTSASGCRRHRKQSSDLFDRGRDDGRNLRKPKH